MFLFFSVSFLIPLQSRFSRYNYYGLLQKLDGYLLINIPIMIVLVFYYVIIHEFLLFVIE
ncbi:hypothetical protein A9G45_08985 [Gilliamella sp. HK2]|nr:hypothetical protein A9G46_08510 [Gilliamella apicola]OCG27486.1 hypothetical protein A9G45_08985 [Gilliamella apicola]OCG58418.1 hypothetical protein A9G40_10120 [Gilliamella apicola]